MKAQIILQMKQKMEKAIEALKKDFSKIRTGRASLSILDGLKVDYYGTPTPLNQVASLSVPESRLINIQPWEVKLISEIEKSILKSDLGLNPTNDGKVIRLQIPQLNEERRKELVKTTKKMAEESKVIIRKFRREANEEVKALEKKKEISEDELKKSEKDIQDITDKFIAKIDEILIHKEKEIMEV